MTFSRKESFRKSISNFPKARENEVEIFRDVLGHEHRYVLELCSGNGFLTKRVKGICDVIHTVDKHFNECRSSDLHMTHDVRHGLPSRKLSESYDAVVSLAAMHHVAWPNLNSPPPLLLEDCYKTLKEGGLIVIADVPHPDDDVVDDDSPAGRTSSFFDKVIDNYCKTSHNSSYLIGRSTIDAAKNVGFTECSYSAVSCPWKFNSMYDASIFVKEMFDLDMEDNDVSESLSSIVGTKKRDGQVLLNWGLGVFRLLR